MVKFTNEDKLKDLFKDGQTIMFSGMSGYGYPPRIISAIKNSDAKDLTLIYIENNSLFDKKFDDVTEIIKVPGKVKKIICSHLGKLSLKENLHYVEDIEVEVYPMGVLAQKMQAGANGVKGILIDFKLASIYRDAEYLKENTLYAGGKIPKVSVSGMAKTTQVELLSVNAVGTFEKALNADFGCILAENVDKFGRVNYNRTKYNSKDVIKAAEVGIIEYEHLMDEVDFDHVDIESPWVHYAIPSADAKVKVTKGK